MKRISQIFALIAVIGGLTAAFAFTNAPAPSTTTYWFDTDALGNPTAYDPSGPQCMDISGDYCAKEYNATQLNFSGGVPVSVKSGQQNNQIAEEHKGN
jgi:hypothetical protein